MTHIIFVKTGVRSRNWNFRTDNIVCNSLWDFLCVVSILVDHKNCQSNTLVEQNVIGFLKASIIYTKYHIHLVLLTFSTIFLFVWIRQKRRCVSRSLSKTNFRNQTPQKHFTWPKVNRYRTQFIHHLPLSLWRN